MNNKGSATVEMSMVFPIVLVIVAMTIFLFVEVIKDGIHQGDAFSEIYCYTDNSNRNNLEIYKLEGYLIADGTYKTEYDLCTSRLRRWQFYGDVLSE